MAERAAGGILSSPEQVRSIIQAFSDIGVDEMVFLPQVLGLKQTEPNPWDLIENKYAVGTTISGKVKSLTDFGAFVGLDEGIDGLIHISDMSWTKHVKHPSEIFKKGAKTEAVVLKIDREKERLSLGYKQLTANPWDEFIPAHYQVGQISKGQVSKITDFGVFVELEGGVEGLIHVSEADLEGSTKIEDHFTLNAEVEAKLIKVDTVERKIASAFENTAETLNASKSKPLMKRKINRQKTRATPLRQRRFQRVKPPCKPVSTSR